MTQDEQRMLQDLADKIANTPAPPRDPEAEDFIRRHIGNRPDALYLMTQTVLIQNLALQHAQEQIQQLQRQTNALPSAGGSFLGQGAPQSRGAGYGSQYAAPPPPQYQPPQPAAPSPSVAAPSGAPSFLRGAAQTAAGVAAGAFAFEGIRSLFSHPGYGGGGLFGGGGWGGGGGYAPVEETVVNNYYDEPRNDDFGRDNVDVNNYDDSGSNFDTTNVDDGGFDDGGGFDGGGGDDSNFV